MISPRLRHHRTQGQSVVLIALAIVLLVGVAGLGLDGANAFNQRRNAGNAADAASVAGANVLITQQKKSPAGPSSAVYSEVATYLSSHGIDPNDPNNPWTAYYVDSSGNRSLGTVTNTSTTVSANAKGISVDVRNTFNTYFMGILGRSTLTVGNSSTAIFGPHTVPGSLLPLTLSITATQQMQSSPGSSYVFNGGGGNSIDSGNFGGISLNPNNDIPNATGNYSDCTSPSGSPDNPSYWWCNGTDHQIQTDEYLWGAPGMVSGSLQDEVQYRIENNPIGLVPIYDVMNNLSGNNHQYHIIGFMVVELQSQCLSGSGCNPKTITATYKDYAVSTGAIDVNAPVTGLYAINLIKTPGTLQ